MRQQLLDLNEVQRIDLAIRDIEKRYEAIPTRLKELEATIAQTGAELATLTGQREAIVKEVRTIEAAIGAENLKLRKWDARLAEIRNQREYLALSREIEGGKRQNREQEEKIAELNAQREAAYWEAHQAKVAEVDRLIEQYRAN